MARTGCSNTRGTRRSRGRPAATRSWTVPQQTGAGRGRSCAIREIGPSPANCATEGWTKTHQLEGTKTVSHEGHNEGRICVSILRSAAATGCLAAVGPAAATAATRQRRRWILAEAMVSVRVNRLVPNPVAVLVDESHRTLKQRRLRSGPSARCPRTDRACCRASKCRQRSATGRRCWSTGCAALQRAPETAS